MEICFMCDLHLPSDRDAQQYRTLDWAIEDIIENKPECIVYAGDVTCDGNADVYTWFVDKMKALNIPFLYIPGNSDLRCAESCELLAQKASSIKNSVNGINIFAINDCRCTISDLMFNELENATDKDVVFMHHPFAGIPEPSVSRFKKWREEHKNTVVFYAHMHTSFRENNSISLQAMDPDKAIGENPCITYYNTDTDEIRKSYYYCPVPDGLTQFFGISCYNPTEQIRFAIQNRLKNIELRPNCIDADEDELQSLVEEWRKSGGENLAIHFPDVVYDNGEAVLNEKAWELVLLFKKLKADRITQHVPRVSVKTVNEDKNALYKICNSLSELFNSIDYDITIGIENMHMTSADSPDDNRRYGYIPAECIEFMHMLSDVCRHKVGINFDIGHARNNMPYSQRYQISTWFSQLGRFIVGYHMHQVTYENNVFENHMPITDIYGKLISYASFFRCWSDGQISKAPVIFEMRPANAYEITLRTFENCK